MYFQANELTLDAIKVLFTHTVNFHLKEVYQISEQQAVDDFVNSQWPLVQAYLLSDAPLRVSASDLTCSFALHIRRMPA